MFSTFSPCSKYVRHKLRILISNMMSPCGIRLSPCQLPVEERQLCTYDPDQSSRRAARTVSETWRVDKGAISHCGGPETSATGANPSCNDSIVTHKGSAGYLPTLMETMRPEKIAESLQKVPRVNPQDNGQKMQNSRLSLLCCVCSVVTVASWWAWLQVQKFSQKLSLFWLLARISGQCAVKPSVMSCRCYAHLLHQIQVQCRKIRPLSVAIRP